LTGPDTGQGAQFTLSVPGSQSRSIYLNITATGRAYASLYQADFCRDFAIRDRLAVYHQLMYLFPATERLAACTETARNSLSAVAIVVAVLTAGCASQSAEQAAAEPGSSDLGQPNYVPDAGYHVLMAEMALQRGEYRVTAQEYVRAAQLSMDPAVAAKATEYAFNYGFISYARDAAARWVQLEPENAKANGYLGILYLKQGDAELAYRHLEQTVPENPTAGEYRTLEATLASEGDALTGLAVMERFAKRDSESALAWTAASNMAARNDEGEKATDYAERALKLDSELAQAKIALYHGQVLDGRADEAIAAMQAYVAASPGVPSELEYVRLLVTAERYDEAIAQLDDMDERFGFIPEIIRFHALISIDRDDQPAAWSSFTKLLRAEYYANESFYYLGQMSGHNREYLQALRLYSRVRSGYLYMPAQIAIAGILEEAGNTDGAIAHLEDVYKQYPRFGFDIWVAKAGFYSAAGDFDASLDAYQRALEYQPDNIPVMLGRAAVLDEKGELDQAIASFRMVLAIAPDNPDAQNALGYTLANRNMRLREAEKLISSALKQYPENAAYLDSMGWLLFRRGKYPEAESYLEQAYAAHDDPEIAAHLGELMWVQGREGEANIIWLLALEEHPRHRVLIETVERFQ